MGRGIVVREGCDLCLLSTGNLLPLALSAAKQLENKSVSAQVVSLHTVKPLDEDLLYEVFSRYRMIVTLEEHSLLGGLGGSIAEWLADHTPQKAILRRMGTADMFLHEAGGQEYAREYFGLMPYQIAERVYAEFCAYVESVKLP